MLSVSLSLSLSLSVCLSVCLSLSLSSLSLSSESTCHERQHATQAREGQMFWEQMFSEGLVDADMKREIATAAAAGIAANHHAARVMGQWQGMLSMFKKVYTRARAHTHTHTQTDTHAHAHTHTLTQYRCKIAVGRVMGQWLELQGLANIKR